MVKSNVDSLHPPVNFFFEKRDGTIHHFHNPYELVIGNFALGLIEDFHHQTD